MRATGSWRVADGQFCMRFQGFNEGQEACPVFVRDGERISAQRPSGEPLDWRVSRTAADSAITPSDAARSSDDLRAAEITDEHLRIAEIVRPKLVQDGMFLVGLDIVGDKLMEINVFSPGGLGSAQRFEKVDFNLAVLHALERKVQYMSNYRRNFDNTEMATL